MHENDIASIVVDCSYRIHTTLGPGLLESVYEEALQYELAKHDLTVYHQYYFPVIYEDLYKEYAFRVDLFVENKVIVEIKSVEQMAKVFYKQILTYMKLSGVKLGLLINFNEPMIKNGIKRLVNNL